MSTKEKPTWGPKAWIPVRRGPIYCSPACGAKCTFAAYEEVHRKANALLAKMKTKGWTVRVHENCAWYYCLHNGFISLYESDPRHCVDRRKPYHCMMTDREDSVGSGRGDWTLRPLPYFSDPNDAVDFILEYAREDIDEDVGVIFKQDLLLTGLGTSGFHGPIGDAGTKVFCTANEEAHKLSWCNANVASGIAEEVKDAFLRACAKWKNRCRDVVVAQRKLKAETAKLNRKVSA